MVCEHEWAIRIAIPLRSTISVKLLSPFIGFPDGESGGAGLGLWRERGGLTAFGAAITALDGMKDAPRQATVNRKVATISLPEAIAFTRSVYRNKLDKMMAKFKTSAPDFYSAYFAARVVVDRTGTHKSKKVVTPTPLPATPPVPV